MKELELVLIKTTGLSPQEAKEIVEILIVIENQIKVGREKLKLRFMDDRIALSDEEAEKAVDLLFSIWNTFNESKSASNKKE